MKAKALCIISHYGDKLINSTRISVYEFQSKLIMHNVLFGYYCFKGFNI